MSPSSPQRDHLRAGISRAGRSHDDALPIIQSVVSWWQGLRSHELTLSLRSAAAARRGGRDRRALLKGEPAHVGALVLRATAYLHLADLDLAKRHLGEARRRLGRAH